MDRLTYPVDQELLRNKITILTDLRAVNRSLLQEIDTLMVSELALRDANQRLQYQAENDGLTGLYTRRKGLEILCAEMNRVQRGQQQLSVIMMDLDYFKQVNDTHGHHAGDLVLLEIARRLTRACRSNDSVSRWGGEEILIICPHTDSAQAQMVACRFHQCISSTPIEDVGGMDLVVTASLGIASTDNLPLLSAEALVAHADEALYFAKRDGRNCVRISRM